MSDRTEKVGHVEKQATDTVHIPVLCREVLSSFSHLPENDSATVLDGTLGGGGHSEAILEAFPKVTLTATDQDSSACERAAERLAPYQARTTILHQNFSDISPAFPFDAILVDLGISSDQLDDPLRGFSFRGKELDMRMNTLVGMTAQEILNTYSEGDLRRVFYVGGMRQGVPGLVKSVVRNRPIRSVDQFRILCEEALAVSHARRRASKPGGVSHPATVPFQALRIEVNDEFGNLNRFLDRIPEILAPGGRLAVIAFHSAEDEAVTRRMREWSRVPQVRRGLPQGSALGKILTPKPILPTEEEIAQNSRARSARLRVFERNAL